MIDKPNILEELQLMGVEVFKKGRNYKCRSFLGNKDSNPSVIINVEENIWYDFSAGQGGDSFDIKALRLGVSRESLFEKKKKEYIYPEIKINNFVASFYNKVLTCSTDGQKALDYLKRRGVNDKIITKMNLGATLNEFKLDELLKEFAKNTQGITEIDVKTSPLFKEVTVGNKTYRNELFHNRLMFPICNESGNVLGFTARTLDKDETIKYLNSSESEVFHKKSFLYNINNAISEIKKKKQVYIVEGPFDVIAYMSLGYENVVSTLTCNISEEQLIKLLSIGGKDLEFIFAFDSDKAGRNGIKNALELMKQYSIWNYKIINYKHKDAGCYLENQELEELDKIISNPLTISGYLALFYKVSKDIKKKSSILNSFINLSYTFPNFILEELVKEFAKKINEKDNFIFEKINEKKEDSKVLLKMIFYLIKENLDAKKVFELAVNQKLLKKEELDVLNNLGKYNLSKYKNSYKASNLIFSFIKVRTKEILE